MTDLYDLNDLSVVIDCVDDAVGALANPIALIGARKLLGAGKSWGARKTLDSGNDPRANRAGLDGLELLGRRSLDEKAIACHAGEAP